MPGVFVTGTDTGIGKTRIAQALVAGLRNAGQRCVGMKPVATGAIETPQGRRSEDALALMAQASVQAPYALINPYLFIPPIAPHIAAREAGIAVRFAHIGAAYAALCDLADSVVVEGVGGWRAPLGEEGGVAELVNYLELPVILVVGIRLGCINHALLTAESIVRSAGALTGWVANIVEPGLAHEEDNIATLCEALPATCLGVLPYAPEANAQVCAAALSVLPVFAG